MKNIFIIIPLFFFLVLSNNKSYTQWKTEIKTFTNENLNSVYFFENDDGWIASTEGSVFATSDGGNKWNKQNTKISTYLSCVNAYGNNLWAVGTGGIIIKSENMGYNWIKNKLYGVSVLRSVYFTDNKRGWTVGSEGSIFYSEDYGRSWSRQESNLSVRMLNSVYFVEDFSENNDIPIGWAVGERGIILNTKNCGLFWNKQNSTVDITLNGVYFINRNSGWVIGQNGTIINTKDGGNTWSSQNCPSSGTLNSIHFKDFTTGWIVGYTDIDSASVIIRTTNAGQSWLNYDNKLNQHLRSVFACKNGTVWIVGFNGTLVKISN